MTTIDFRSDLRPLTLAFALADVVYGHPQSYFTPFYRNSSGHEHDDVDQRHPFWIELSPANDHKLDVRGGGRFSYRDRYTNPERIARVRACLAALGATLEESP